MTQQQKGVDRLQLAWRALQTAINTTFPYYVGRFTALRKRLTGDNQRGQ
jgi:hypothetical protein